MRKNDRGGGNAVNDASLQNKIAWEYNAYDFWVMQAGKPEALAKKISENPMGHLRKYSACFDRFEGVKIANICGSCGKKAVPLALLGAEVTVFDISRENRRYAMETAKAAGATLNYEVGDVLEIDLHKYGGFFDVVFMEGGVLHYFHDIDAFMKMMYALLKNGGKMILSDFHPLTKSLDVLGFERPPVSYFYKGIVEGEMPHARFYGEEKRKTFPKCSLRLYSLSEIINSVIRTGFLLKSFDEHPAWTNPDLPGEFTIVANK